MASQNVHSNLFMLSDRINFAVRLLDSDRNSLICLSAYRLCHLLLWEVCPQFLIVAFANATEVSIAGFRPGVRQLNPLLLRQLTFHFLLCNSDYVSRIVRIECKYRLGTNEHSWTNFKVIKGLLSLLLHSGMPSSSRYESGNGLLLTFAQGDLEAGF